jgi:hypothetical protein
MFDALHGGIPWLRVNGIERPSFHSGYDRLLQRQDDEGRPKVAATPRRNSAGC